MLILQWRCMSLMLHCAKFGCWMTQAAHCNGGVQEMLKGLCRFTQTQTRSHYTLITLSQVALCESTITSAALFWDQGFLCLAVSFLSSATSLSNALASLTVNCSVLLLSVALGLSQTLAPLPGSTIKGRRRRKLCVCLWTSAGQWPTVCVCSFEREVV